MTTSVDDLKSDNQTTVYPNPTKSHLTFKTNQTSFTNQDKIVLYSILGKQLYSSVLSSQQTIIYLTDFPQGSYILVASVNGISKTFKIIKE